LEQLGDAALSVGIWAGYIVWVVILFASSFLILIGLPGGWIALGCAVLYDLIHGFGAIGWTWLAIFTGLLVVAEVIEAGLGTLYVAKKGATAYGMIGAFVGGIAGAVVGSNIVPIIGTVLGSFAGALAGAVAGEYLREERLEPSMRIGVHALVGRVAASMVKYGLALVGCVSVAVAAWPG
jgi:uncharacterized protein YqgC (DUF456 family)